MIESLKTFLRRLLNTSRGGIRYKIGGGVYIQRPLVLGQIEQLTALLSTLEIPVGVNVVGIVRLLGGRIAEALAIVLTPEGVDIRDKVLADESAFLKDHVDLETAARVVEDFLSCNPISSVFDRLTGIMDQGAALLGAPGAGSRNSSASSLAET